MSKQEDTQSAASAVRDAVAAELGRPENFDTIIQQGAAGLLLAAWHSLRADGQDSRAALGQAAYLLLVTVYGREWCREHLGLAARTERDWYAKIRGTADRLGDEPSAELLALAVSGGFAALRNSSGVGGGR